MTDFNDFGLAKPILNALANEGHKTPTPIQRQAIPPLLKGRDLLGIAQTGTGKTAAFALPILHSFSKTSRNNGKPFVRVVVLTPTRELAAQVLDRFQAYGRGMGLRVGLIIGGASIHKQRQVAKRGIDIVVATPGRLIDLVDRGAIRLDQVDTFVLDEVDQMLDLGFIHPIRAIAAKLPRERQNLFFSATMPRPIAQLAGSLLRDPVRVEIEAAQRPKIDQSIMFMEKPEKSKALIEIVGQKDFTRGLVFSRTKHGADKLVRVLQAAGASAHAIHGNRSQGQRERALAAFRKGNAPILVATDIAARGIDIPDVSHVINYDLPNVPETYVHRIGRTARAGATGIAISFCSREERSHLRSIERLTKQRIRVVGEEFSDDHSSEQRRGDKPANDDRRPRRFKAKRKGGAPFSSEQPKGNRPPHSKKKKPETADGAPTKFKRKKKRVQSQQQDGPRGNPHGSSHSKPQGQPKGPRQGRPQGNQPRRVSTQSRKAS